MNVTNLWRKDYLRATEGSIFTFSFLLSVGPNVWNDRLIFELSYALQYRFFIHDPKYFVLTWNNAYFPVTFLDSKPNTTNNFYIKFDLVEVMYTVCHQAIIQHTNDIFQVEELDLPEDRCNLDKKYDFNGCVRKSLSRQVGKCKIKEVFIPPRWGAGLSGMYGVRQIWF